MDKVSFTGSTETGREIVRASAGNLKRVTLELGGKAPSLVLPGADLDAAVAGCLQGALLNSGQVCAAYTRFLVHRFLADEFAERCAKAVSGMRLGAGSAPDTELGPLVTGEHRDHVHALVRSGVQQGAQLLAGGAPVDDLPGRLSAVYSLASAVLIKLGSYDRARLTADRARTWAEISGSPLAAAAAARELAIVLRHQDQHGAAQRLMSSVTDDLETSGLRTDAMAAAYAQMLCTLAYTAARAGQRTEALAMAEEARRAARRLPQAAPRSASSDLGGCPALSGGAPFAVRVVNERCQATGIGLAPLAIVRTSEGGM
ncbi:aldehyde dehydrogenase [Streptomyces sp. V4I2]|uniref:aldehyde dehydrogenase family protein n=1 Tax=Streptomyces sp. V4I2 TaxID=3042280 RepID=UPI003593851F